jgi:hypothetical protein
MSLSAVVIVQDGVGTNASVPSGGSVQVTPGTMLSISLQSTSQVASWTLSTKSPTCQDLDGRMFSWAPGQPTISVRFPADSIELTFISTVYDSGGGSASSTGRLHSIGLNATERTINVMNPPYGAMGDGVTDDTAAIQRAINASTSTNQTVGDGAVLTFPRGTYRITSTLVINSGGALPALVNWHGSGGATQLAGSTILWDGPSGQALLTGASIFQGDIGDINFNGNGKALTCCQLLPTTTNVRLHRCGFFSTQQLPVWQANTGYMAGSAVLSPINPYCNSYWYDNGHVYIAQNSGISGAGGPSGPTFTTGAGDLIADNTITWKESGFSPCGVAAGDESAVQVSELLFNDCLFLQAGGSTASGFSQVAGFSNVKNFSFLDCEFVCCGTSIHAPTAAGSYQILHGIFASCGLDVWASGSNTVMSNCESEGSRMMFMSQSYGPAMLSGNVWFGNTVDVLNFAPGGPTIVASGGAQVQLTGNTIYDGSTSGPPRMLVTGTGTGSITSGAFFSESNLYTAPAGYSGPAYLAVCDSGGNYYDIAAPAGFFPNTMNASHRMVSRGDTITSLSGGRVISIDEVCYSDVRTQRQSLAAPSAGPFGMTPASVAVRTNGIHCGAVASYTVPFAAVQAGATSSTVYLSTQWTKMRIRAILLDVIVGFAGPGISSVTIEVGKQTANNGTDTAAFLAASNVQTATGSAAIYAECAGPSALVWQADNTNRRANLWQFTLTARSAGANLSALTQGILDVYIFYDVAPANLAGVL